jgi:hypothetical protein
LATKELEVPTTNPYTDRMKNKEYLDEITYIPYPAKCDGDIVAEIIGDDQYDVIFLDNGIVCKNDRVDDINQAIQESLEDIEE